MFITAHVQGSEDNLSDSVRSFYLVGLGTELRSPDVVVKRLCLLSHFTDPLFFFFSKKKKSMC